MKLLINIESYAGAWIGSIGNDFGIVVESDSLEGVLEELVTSLNVKLSYKLGVPMNGNKIDIESLKQRFSETGGQSEVTLGMSLA